LPSTGFVLDPDGRVIVSVYSSGAIGRLIPQDVVGLIGYLRGTAIGSSFSRDTWYSEMPDAGQAPTVE
jgi:hypothetical protein